MDIMVTPTPEDYRLIVVVARRFARSEVEAQLRAEGLRLMLIPHRDIIAKASEYLAQHPEFYRQAAQTVAQHPEWLPKRRKRRPDSA